MCWLHLRIYQQCIFVIDKYLIKCESHLDNFRYTGDTTLMAESEEELKIDESERGE